MADLQIIKRKDAKRLGLKRYFEGSECLNGHIALRFLNGTCCECQAMPARRAKAVARVSKWRVDQSDIKERRAREMREWRKRYPEKAKEFDRIRRMRTTERHAVLMRAWRKKNKEHIAAYRPYHSIGARRFQLAEQSSTPLQVMQCEQARLHHGRMASSKRSCHDKRLSKAMAYLEVTHPFSIQFDNGSHLQFQIGKCVYVRDDLVGHHLVKANTVPINQDLNMDYGEDARAHVDAMISAKKMNKQGRRK